MFNPDSRMRQAVVPLPKPDVHTAHPFVDEKNHEALLDYLKARLLAGKQTRDNELERLVRVDKKVSGWMKLSAEDKKRKNQQDVDGSPQPTLMNLPLAWVHLDDMMTYFAQTFAPNRGMFYHTGKPDETQEASQIVTKMNNDAIYSGYFTQLLAGVFTVLKYNQGGFMTMWSSDSGPKISVDANGKAQVEQQIRWRGNRLEAIDLYNFMRDPMVPVDKLYCDGEFCAQARIKSHYWLSERASRGIYYNCETVLSEQQDLPQTLYYRAPPKEAQIDQDESASGTTNWVSVLSGVDGYALQAGYELVEIYIRLNPTEFGLIPGPKKAQAARSRYEVWRFTLLNDEKIIDATYMNNIHGWLPCFMGVLNDSMMGSSSKSIGEILQPLGDFASFLVNTHILGSRSELYGLTFYDPTILPFDQVPKGEVSARVPCLPAGYGKDLRTAVYSPESNVETKQTIGDLGGVMDLINQFFPTAALPSQIAGIDRAVDSQVAAVQQGANRRLQKAARSLDDSIFRNVRATMYYNIIQYQVDGEEITDYYTGRPVTIDLAKLRQTDLPFIIGQGLKAIDRQAAASAMQQVIFALIQAPAVAAETDILGMVDYWTSMIDIDIDMTQFRKAPPPAPGAPPGEGTAPDGSPISPVTAPASLTAPILG